MARDVNRIRMGISVDRKLGERLNQLSEDTRISKAKLFDEALEYLFQMHNIKVEEYEYKFLINHVK